MPVYALHRMKEYFGEDADEFNPDRFYSGQVDSSSIVFHPFGGGPRMCLGMRFALIEMKICIGRLLFDYEVLEKPGSRINFKCDGLINLLQFDKAEVVLNKRTN